LTSTVKALIVNEPLLLPPPQKLTLTGGTLAGEPEPEIVLSPDYPHREGYTLTIDPAGVRIVTQTEAGAFYAQATLNQLKRQYGAEIPCMVIEDWPDFGVRGIMMDISRDRVPKMDMLYLWIDRLAALKINQFQLYMEHTFEYPSHPDVWREASPMTADEIHALEAYCKARFIDLVPCQNGFGHMERWLKHERYADLAITPNLRTNNMGDTRLPSTLNPLDPRSIELVASIYDDLLPHFSSKLFNGSADEPFELGQGRTEQAVQERGKGRVYLEYLLELYKLVTARGRQMQFWGDIIIHYPELVPELPKDLIALDWGYEEMHDFDAHAKVYADAGVPFYLCPGTSTWNALVGCVDNMLGNIRNAARAGVKYGALGILTTDWGDNGHWQPPGISWPGFAAGAAMSWNASSADMDAEALAPLLDLHIYEGDVAEAVLALGNLYRRIGPQRINGQLLAFALQRRYSEIPRLKAGFEKWGDGTPADISPQTLREVAARIDELSAEIQAANINAHDGELLREELLHGAAMLKHGAKRLLLMQEEGVSSPDEMRAEWKALQDRHNRLWLERSRPGGLVDSVDRFKTAYLDYE
jgi:hexosaminidase